MIRGYDAWKTRSPDDERSQDFPEPEDDMPEPEENLPALPATPMEMVAQAVARNATPETLERLLALQERWERNQAEKAFEKAISAARGKIAPIFKNREARMGQGRPNYRYEDLAAIDRSVVPILSDYGLSYRFNTRVPDNRPDLIIVTCRVAHKDGWHEESSLPGPADTSGAKNPIQAISSTVTYLKRTTLKAALGLSSTDEDDDDGAAGEPQTINEQQVAQLRERIEQVGQTEERVCAYFKIRRLEDLPLADFDTALAKLKPKQ